MPPDRGRDDGMGGIVTLEWAAAGRHQVALSSHAWMDVVQDDRRLADSRFDRSMGLPRHSPQRAVRDRRQLGTHLPLRRASVRHLDVAVRHRLVDFVRIGVIAEQELAPARMESTGPLI